MFFSKGWRPGLEYYDYWWTPRSAAMFLEFKVHGKFSWNTHAQIHTHTHTHKLTHRRFGSVSMPTRSIVEVLRLCDEQVVTTLTRKLRKINAKYPELPDCLCVVDGCLVRTRKTNRSLDEAPCSFFHIHTHSHTNHTQTP